MSVKHIREQYQQITEDYMDMLDSVKELEQAVSEKVVSQEKLDNIKQQLEIIRTNYMRWQYVMFLLDKPNKKVKQKKYNKTYTKMPKTEHEENKEALNKFKDNINNL